VLALAHPLVLPSAMLNDVGTPVAIISQLDTLPALPPVNASMAASRLATHDSGPGWLATPFLYDSFIHNSTPVYPGALSSLLGAPAPCTASPSPLVLLGDLVAPILDCVVRLPPGLTQTGSTILNFLCWIT
jgi:hypothetical protein